MISESTIHGTWIYAEDPAGELPTDAVYTDSVVHFGADNVYRFTMGQITLEGTYEVVSTDSSVQTKVTLVSGSQMDIAVHRQDAGIVVVEGDGTLPGRYYAPNAD
jgi:hypothetical protein